MDWHRKPFTTVSFISVAHLQAGSHSSEPPSQPGNQPIGKCNKEVSKLYKSQHQPADEAVLEQINLSDPNKAERSWFGCPSKGNQKI
jgi:hypothetical protein